MIIFKQCGIKQEVYIIKYNQEIILYFEEEKIIISLNEKINYRFSKKLQFFKHNDYFVTFYNKITNNPCDIYISIFDDNYNYFKRYTTNKKCISIGSSIDDDIYIQDVNIKKNHLILNLLDFSFENIYEPYAYSNNICRKNNKKVKEINLLNLKIIFNKDFIMVNSCMNIFVGLSIYNLCFNKYEIIHNINLVYKRFRNDYLFEFKKYNIKNINLYEKNESSPLIFSIGPAITLAFASLLSGLFSSYNSYLQGKNIKEIFHLLLLPVVMIISILLWNPLQRKFEKRNYVRKKTKIINDYKKYLNDIELSVINSFERYKKFIDDNFYLPNQFYEKKLFWQKSKSDNDWLLLCLGVGDIKNKFEINYEDEYHEDIRELINSFKLKTSTINQIKMLFNLIENKNLSVVFNSKDDDLFLFYLLYQICIYYPYDEVKIAIICERDYLYKNSFIYHIPHLYNESNNRYLATNSEEVKRLNKIIDEDVICFVLSEKLSEYFNPKNNISIYKNSSYDNIPNFINSYIILNGYNGMLFIKNKTKVCFKFNELSQFNKQEISNIFLDNRLSTQKIIKNNIFITLFDEYSLKNETILNNWNTNSKLNNLKVLIGKTVHNENIYLDLHENGNGPHGLIAGTTGSGKSELIITLMVGLSINYSPKYVNFLLIDFKGGGIINNFKNKDFVLPHIVGAISNLDKNMLIKCIVSLKFECEKRQKLFKKMGEIFNFHNINIDTYINLYEDSLGIERLSHLIIIVDEFAELKKNEPDFLYELITIARIGRSLGIHLILSTQKPSGIIDDQIWSNCHFKICLKVQDYQDSLDVIKIKDAAKIKNIGKFYMLYDEILQEGQAIYSNAPIELKNEKIIILDSLKEKIYETKTKNNLLNTQLSYVVKKIQQLNTYNVNNLWLNEIKFEDYNINFNNKIFLGIVDDFYNGNHKELYASKENIVVYSLDISEKIKFLKTYLYFLSKNYIDNEIYIFNFLNVSLNEYKKLPNIIEIVNNNDFDKVDKIFLRCMEAIKNTNIKITLIITHYPTFKEIFETYFNKLKYFIENGVYYGINILIFTSLHNTLSYSESLLIEKKISLYNLSKNEICSIFEINTNLVANKKGFGLIKFDNLLEFKIYEICEKTLNNFISTNQNKDKIYKINSINKNLSIKDYNGLNVPIGIDYKTNKWIEIYSEGIYITGVDTILLDEFIEKRRGCIIEIVSCNKMSLNSDKPLLWIGEGYLNQYIIPVKLKYDLQSDEGIYFYKNEIRKVYIV
ncbi:MAG: hypothetical protein MR601_02500 [Erysipelotrichaceae bacterium]|nr:hypothetical protein [Erysipelotrichaceae bacterium]